MTSETISKLLSINRQFYQTFAQAFDATRQRVQPGAARALDLIPKEARILDLGCGNGEVARELARRGFRGEYVGVDFSEGLVEAARKELPDTGGWRFEVGDLTVPNWDAGLDGPYDVVLAFAVLHHLPVPFHIEILQKMRRLLVNPPPSTAPPKPRFAQDASFFPLFIFSNWQFLNSPRWQARVQPWGRVGLTSEDVDANDYLLDWRRGGEGLRYVHHFSEEELARLAETAVFEIVETFHADGKEGNLALYQIWRPQ